MKSEFKMKHFSHFYFQNSRVLMLAGVLFVKLLKGSKTKPLYNVKKCLSTLITYAEKYNKKDSLQYLREEECIPEDSRNVKHHKQCQRRVNNENRERSITSTDFQAEKESSKEKMLRSSLEPFDWKDNCLFCGKLCQRDSKYPERSDFHETLRFKNDVLSACQKRADAVSRKLSLRVSTWSDLVAEEACYHNSCRSTFKNPSKNRCMLLHHYEECMSEVYFQTMKKKSGNRQTWNISEVIEKTDESVLKNILFLHDLWVIWIW